MSQNILCPSPLQGRGLYDGFCLTWTWTLRFQLLGPIIDISKFTDIWFHDKIGCTCLYKTSYQSIKNIDMADILHLKGYVKQNNLQLII